MLWFYLVLWAIGLLPAYALATEDRPPPRWFITVLFVVFWPIAAYLLLLIAGTMELVRRWWPGR